MRKARYYFKILFVFVIGIYSLSQESLIAQDLHYSQHIYNSLYYNPAFTGLISNRVRLTASYADRYRQAYGKDGMQTIFGSADFQIPIVRNNINYRGFGAGVYFYNHTVGQNAISDNVASVLFSYRMGLGKDNKHMLSVGFNGNYVSRKYGYNSLQFGNQYDGFDYNSSILSGENINTESRSKVDAGLGLLYTFNPNKKINGYLGTSVFHLIPDKDEVNGIESKLRYNVHAGVEFHFNQLSLQPSLLLDIQNQAMELYTGIQLKYQIASSQEGNTALFIGPYVRNYQSPVSNFNIYTFNLVGGIEFNDLEIVIATDNTMGKAKDTFSNFNGIELGLTYQIGHVKNQSGRIYCPTFR